MRTSITFRMEIETDAVFLVQPLDVRKDLGYGAKGLKATIQHGSPQQMDFEFLASLLFRLMDFKVLAPNLWWIKKASES